ncbi:MAG: hypothetical protein GTO14_17005 [Anaerolineales bacterium]|nr:hypothetical protein [Anaerolineales bacterium]
MTTFFPILILTARPAAGKSEIIHFLEQIPVDERIERYHVGPIHILDDFPMLWAWFEEDDLLERIFDKPRLYTTPDGYFLHEDLWHLLIRRLSLDYHKWRRDTADPHTVMIEFSRGSPSGGYQAAFQHLSDEILQMGASLYVEVSYEESLRKNRKRANNERPDSTLEHSVEDKKMERLYRDDDWSSFSASDPNFLTVRGIRVPYVIFENEDDITTRGGNKLEQRLEDALGHLWALWEERPTV